MPAGIMPCCAKCGSKKFAGVSMSFAGVEGVMVYCFDCGAAVGWGPRVKS
jgi:hypothetical protein